MKKSVLLSSLISLIVVLLITIFGAYALLLSTQPRTSQVVIHVTNQNLDVRIDGLADWIPDGTAEKEFTTEINQETEGPVDQTWNMPNIQLKTSDPDNRVVPVGLWLTIHNNNQNDVYNLKIVVEGIAFDQHNRFSSAVTCTVYALDPMSGVVSGVDVTKDQKITETERIFERYVPCTAQDIVLYFTYQLTQFNSSFDINQTINITISTEEIEA